MGSGAVKRFRRGLIAAIVCLGVASPSQVAFASFQDAEEELPDPQSLSDDEKIEWAKKLYLQAKEFHDNEDFYNSVIKYEQAYSYAPDKHIFAYNLGVDAWELKDCARVKQYLQLFLIKDEEHEDLQEDARAILTQAEGNSECITGGPGEVHVDPVPPDQEPPPEDTENPFDLENPPDGGEPEGEKKGPSGMLVGGVVLAVLGAGALGGGAATLVIGKGAADELRSLSTLGDTGFVQQEYDQTVIDLENKLNTTNLATPILLSAGGVLLAGGVALIVVDRLNKNNKRGHYAADPKPKAKVTAFGVAPTRGGAAASLSLRF